MLVWGKSYIKQVSLVALRKTGGKGRKPKPLSKDERELALSRQEASVLWVCKDPDAGQTAESRGIAEAEDRGASVGRVVQASRSWGRLSLSSQGQCNATAGFSPEE